MCPPTWSGSLTGLTEGRFPVYARARYADDQAEGMDPGRGIGIFAEEGSPVVAVNDGVIRKIGQSDRLGNFVVLEDAYGNRFTYSHLGSVSDFYPVPKSDGPQAVTPVKARRGDPAPTAPASAGSQPDPKAQGEDETSEAPATDAPAASLPVKERLFAHPGAPGAKEAGGLEQTLDARARKSGKYETFDAYFSRPIRIDPSKVRLRRLREDARVIGGTVIGRVGRPAAGGGSRLTFSVRPAGKGAPKIDPKPLLDGWKLLEATAIYRASGRNVLYGKGDSASVGQVLLWPKRMLERRVLSDERIELYDGGREDIASGQIDRRVLATLEYLAESGLSPTVTSLKSGHSYLTASGNVSEHSSGSAVDIAKINGIPILGHQEVGGIAEQTVRRLMRLQGTMQPHQVISLLELGGPTIAMARPRGPRPRGLPGEVHARVQARPVDEPAGAPARDREPGGAGQALRVLAAGEEALLPRRLAASRQQARPEAPGQALAAPAHHHVVVVLEHRARDGDSAFIQRLVVEHLPVVDHRGHAGVLEQAPDALAVELAGRAARHRARAVHAAPR